MSQGETTWTSEVYLLVQRADGAVWLEEGTLPRTQVQKRFWLADVAAFVPQLQERFGAATVLRCMYFHADKEAKRVRAVYELEANPIGGSWAKIDQVNGLELEPSILKALESNFNLPDSELRVAWAKPGWFDRASAWVRAELNGLGYQVRQIEQVKTWGLSCVLQVSTDREDVYFKVSNSRPLFCHEPHLTQALAGRFPDLVPRPLAIEPTERWMLLSDVGQSLYEQKIGLEDWVRVVRDYARMQRVLADEVNWMLSVGCLDRRLEVLKSQFDQLLHTPQALKGLSDDEVGQLQTVGPKLLQGCDQLEALGIPYSLLHGDFHPGNIARKNDQNCFFDWTDACVAHPLLDFPYLMDSLTGLLGQEAREPLVEAYLEPWNDLVSTDSLKPQLNLVDLVSFMHQSVTYWKIAESLEPSQSGMDGVVPHFLRQILHRAQGLVDMGQ